MRPWASTDEMREALIANWNAVVKPADTVYHLGDFCFAGATYHGELIPRLNGRIILVRGNHDGFREDRYQRWGFYDVVEHSTRLTLSNGVEVLLCHYPYVSYDDRYPERLPKDEGMYLLHGHVHTSWLSRGRGLNVGVDVWGYEPVSEEQVMTQLEKMRIDDVYAFIAKHGSE
jgi:calcineurin-like phosphoesterase family protein